MLLPARDSGALLVGSGMLNGRYKPLYLVDAATSTREVFASGL